MPAGLATPVSIHDVASQRGKEQKKGHPEVLASSLSGVVQAQKDADGAATRISQGEEVGLSIRPQHRQMLLARAHERILFADSCAAKDPLTSAGGKAAAMFWSRLRMADHPNHCRCGALESLHQSVEPKCELVGAFKRVDPARTADETVGMHSTSQKPAEMMQES